MSEPTKEEIEEALNGDERKLEDWDMLMWAARQYLASLDAPAPSAREEKLEEALERIEQWSRAYPLDIFPEPDWQKARLLLEEGGMTLDSISAHCMRHVVEGVGKIAQEALLEENARLRARDALEEMFDGDIQQADRILSRLAEEGFVVVPKRADIGG